MGSFVELNDTLQITREQGFPEELDYEKHKNNPIKLEALEGKVFEFKDKKGVRIYKMPPVRVFLVQKIGEKWLYWGLVHVLEILNDYAGQTTSGKFKIIQIYTPEEMKEAHKLIDGRPEYDFFN